MSHQQLSGRLRPRTQWKTAFCALALVLFLVGSIFVAGCSSTKSDSGSVSTVKMAEQEQTARDATTPTASNTADEYKTGTSSQLDYTQGDEIQRKTIMDGSISLKVQDTPQVIADVGKLAEDYGGYIVSSYISKSGEYFNGQIIVKVPQDKMLEVSDKVIAMGELTDRRSTSQDVTQEYYDSQARLKVLQEKELRLTSFMASAQSIEDLISIENELAANRSQIEVLQGRLNYLNNATSYSQLTIGLTQSVPGQVEAPTDAWGRAVQALVTSMNYLVAFLSWCLMALLALAPWLILLFLFIMLLRYLFRKRRARRKAAKQAAQQPPQLPDIK